MTKSMEMALPEEWPDHVANAIRRIAGIMHVVMTHSRSWCANSPLARMRAVGERNVAEENLAVLEQVCELLATRMARIPPAQRAHYTPEERALILTLKAARGWTARETAKKFLVSEATILTWEREIENPDSSLFKTKTPVNAYGNFVRMAVLSLSWYCPRMGRRSLVKILGRAGLHLAASTVKRMKDEERSKPDPPQKPAANEAVVERKIVAKRPEHTIHVDLTTVETTGRWRPEFPHCTPPVYPYCWTVLVVTDHFSRACLGYAVYRQPPTGEQVCTALQGIVDNCKGEIRHVITDKGAQFWKGKNADGSERKNPGPAKVYKAFCRRNKLQPRFGAVGKHGSIAVVERFIRTLKEEGVRPARGGVPMNKDAFRSLLNDFVYWYNAHRPHDTLEGCTPLEVHRDLPRANRKPRIEPRSNWPKDSPCAKPQVPVSGEPGDRPIMSIGFVNGRRHLPVVELISEAA